MIRLYRTVAAGGQETLWVTTGERPSPEEGACPFLNLTRLDPALFASLAGWLRQGDPVARVREAVDAVLKTPCTASEGGEEAPLVRVTDLAGLGPAAPLDRQEVWAAGVTYLRSKEARMEESEGGGDFYDRVYAAERPELFLKATPSRVVGPGEPIRIRRDAAWNVPEPELALLLSPSLRIVGYTLGNDVSSRDIEGENPLYLPQAKLYRQCCALGPGVLLEEEARGHRNFALRLTIARGRQIVFEGETTTAQMKRRFDELVQYLGRDNIFPDGAYLLTGTGIVPPDDFTLAPGDLVTIAAPEIGTLTNRVVQGDTP